MTDIAHRAADKLMTNGFGDKADRLLLVQDGIPNDLGGRCRSSVVKVIDEEIAELRAENERLHTALHDAIGLQIGMAPDSAAEFVKESIDD